MTKPGGQSSLGIRFLKRIDFQLLISFLAILLLILLFRQIANWIDAGTTDRIDFELLRMCRDETPEMKPRGSPKFVGAVRDFTALGSGTVLTFLVITVSLFYFLQGRWRTGLFLLVTSSLGWGLMEWLKDVYARPRPAVVSHLTPETSYSFPSGHAKMSAVIYLTLGIILAQRSRRQSVKVFWMSIAIVLTLCIGCTRVYLGVHHPSDVLAGWIAGTCWALFVFLIARLWRDRWKLFGAGKQPPATGGWRTVSLNLFVILFVFWLIRGSMPLRVLVEQIKPGMKLLDVRNILGMPVEFDDAEYMGAGYVIHEMIDGKEKSVSVEYHYTPYSVVMHSPAIGVKTPHHGAPQFQFTVPYDHVEHPERDQSREIYWFDQTHCFWLALRKDDTVIDRSLVPLIRSEVALKDWIDWQWLRVKRILRW